MISLFQHSYYLHWEQSNNDPVYTSLFQVQFFSQKSCQQDNMDNSSSSSQSTADIQ